MSWQTADLLSADTTDVLAADTTDVLSADTTDVLSADTEGLWEVWGRHVFIFLPKSLRFTGLYAPVDRLACILEG